MQHCSHDNEEQADDKVNYNTPNNLLASHFEGNNGITHDFPNVLSISRMIRSAKAIASRIAQFEAGDGLALSCCASLRDARIAAAIRISALREQIFRYLAPLADDW